MRTTNLDLTLDICTGDGMRTRFYQNDEHSVGKTLRQLVAPQLFRQPLLTLASEHSISAIPSRTIDLIFAHTESPPPLLLPPGCLDIIEVNDEALSDIPALEGPVETTKTVQLLVEIHTLGDWMIRLKLLTAVPPTVPERRFVWNRIMEIPVIPFRLPSGGIGMLNPANISRVTFSPPLKVVTEMALEADLLQCVRA